MKRMLSALLFALLCALAVGSAPAIAGSADELMTKGKLAADLGDQLGAEQVFEKLAADATTPESVRAEALVRLGVVQRALGKTKASTAAFQKAMQSPGRDAQVTRLLTLSLAGVAPDRARWATQWPKVRLVASPGSGHAAIAWPGPGPQGVREALPASDPVTLDLEDVPLTALLHHLLVAWGPDQKKWPWPGPRASVGFESWPDSYRTPAIVERLDFAIHAGIQGHAIKRDPDAGPRVTVQVAGIPWNELFENLLASNGLGLVLQDGLLFIARVEDLDAIRRIHGRAYPGWPVDLHFLTANLLPSDMVTGNPRDRQTWKLVPDIGLLNRFGADIWPHLQFQPDPGVEGTVTLRIRKMPMMKVLDLFLAMNDLAMTRVDARDAKPGTTVLRVCNLADLQGEAVDLSTLAPPPNPQP